jgi:hypothetical protein
VAPSRRRLWRSLLGSRPLIAGVSSAVVATALMMVVRFPARVERNDELGIQPGVAPKAVTFSPYVVDVADGHIRDYTEGRSVYTNQS